MSPPPAPPHLRRSRSTAGTLVSALAPSFLAVLAVAAVITSLHVWQQQESEARVAGVKAGRTVEPREAVSTTPSSPTPSPSDSAMDQTPQATASSASPTPSPSTTTATRLPIAVLNQTRRTGLARRVGAQLRAAGWTVVQIGNFRGNITATTVYFPEGASRQARAVAKDLSVSARTRTTFDGLPANRLTVIVAHDYPQLR